MATLEIGASSTRGIVEMGESSSTIIVETRASTYDRFTLKQFQECTDTWRDENNWPSGMETILIKARVFDFLFGMFSFYNEEIDDAILNYDYVNMELKFFGTRVYLNPDLVSKAKKYHTEGEMFLAIGKPRNWRRNRWPIKFARKLYLFQGRA